MRKKAILLISLLTLTSCQGENTPSGRKDDKPKEEFALEVEDAKTEYKLREEFEPSDDMKVYSIDSKGNKTLLEKNEYKINSASYVGERAGTYPIKISAKKLNASTQYDVKVDTLKSFSILMIGNSHTDDTIQWAHEIAYNLGLENVEIADLYYGGSGMDIHVDNLVSNRGAYSFRTWHNGGWSTATGTTIQSAILSKPDGWDYISLQEKAWYGAIDYQWDLLDTYLELVRLYAHPRTKFCWNLTWAHNSDWPSSSDTTLYDYFGGNQLAMYQAEQGGVIRHIVGRDDFEFIVDGGTAIQNARSSYLTDLRIARDYTHLSYDLGRYIAGLNLIKTISDIDLTNLSWKPDTVTETEMRIAVESVENCIVNRFDVTPSMYKVEP